MAGSLVVEARCDVASPQQVADLAILLGQQQAASDAGLAMLCYQRLVSEPEGRLSLNNCYIVITNDMARPPYIESNRRLRMTLGLPMGGNLPIDELLDALTPPAPPPPDTVTGGSGDDTLTGEGGGSPPPEEPPPETPETLPGTPPEEPPTEARKGRRGWR